MFQNLKIEGRIDFQNNTYCISYHESHELERKEFVIAYRIENQFFKYVSGVKNFWKGGKNL